MKTILERVPAFRVQWQTHLDYWNGEDAGLCNDISQFSHYVTELVVNDQLENLSEIFNLIEQLTVDGDAEVKNAIATCFLENLLNVASTGRVDARKFVNLLGPKSRAYCKAWDEFTGVRTEGL
jgi:hypothetical protein